MTHNPQEIQVILRTCGIFSIAVCDGTENKSRVGGDIVYKEVVSGILKKVLFWFNSNQVDCK